MNGKGELATLTLDDVAQLAGIKPQVFRDWVDDGVITPAVLGGKGRGRSHRFTLTQAVGLVVAAGLRQSERSCALAYVARVVTAFAGVSETWLEEHFKSEGTHLVTIHHGRPLLQGKAYDRPDVRVTFEAVKARADELEGRVRELVDGR